MPVAFSGSRGEFLHLVKRGAGLELVTLGFYRFWLTTDIRRHLWSNTEIDGDGAEYTGRGQGTADRVPDRAGDPGADLSRLIFSSASRPSASRRSPAFRWSPSSICSGNSRSIRARRYRLTRTVWRGVRFWMSGSGWIYALQASLWGLLMIVTLGLVLPWRAAALERYKMRHSYYGDLQGSFEGRGWEFFKRGWWLWLLDAACALHVTPLRCRSSMARSRPWNGAGGCPASGSAACGWNRDCRAAG